MIISLTRLLKFVPIAILFLIVMLVPINLEQGVVVSDFIHQRSMFEKNLEEVENRIVLLKKAADNCIFSCQIRSTSDDKTKDIQKMLHTLQPRLYSLQRLAESDADKADIAMISSRILRLYLANGEFTGRFLLTEIGAASNLLTRVRVSFDTFGQAGRDLDVPESDAFSWATVHRQKILFSLVFASMLALIVYLGAHLRRQRKFKTANQVKAVAPTATERSLELKEMLAIIASQSRRPSSKYIPSTPRNIRR